MSSVLFVLLLLVVAVYCQQGSDSNTPEAHPPLTVQQCTASGCSQVSASITLDANWRWVHTVGGTTNCYTGNQWGSMCTDPVACASNCALEGVQSSDYTANYGITTSADQLRLNFVTQNQGRTNVGSRVYLMSGTSSYQMFNLKGQEFAFDVDVSNLPCGLNGALYFTSMSQDGGMSAYSGNKAGAKYGTGYCDAQCPQDIKFINGEANVLQWNATGTNTGVGMYGTCCNEMDIWEANSVSTAFTPHVCDVDGQNRCVGVNCGAGADRDNGWCDKDGCDFNSYRMGNTTFYGPSGTISTSSKITVVTQFITADGTTNTDLVEIRRFYKQGSTVIPNSASTFSSMNGADSVTDNFCNNQKTLFGDPNVYVQKGGMSKMGQALDKGMVLVMSLWDDIEANCLWLDSNYPTSGSPSTPGVARGTCATSSGVPANVESASPNSYVAFSAIKWGPLGSTTSGVPAPSSGGSTTTGSGATVGSATVGGNSAGTVGGSNGATAGSGSNAAGSTTASGSTSTCQIGAVGCPCTSGGACDKSLTCLSNICVDASGIHGTSSASLAQVSAAAIGLVGAALLL